MSLFCWLLMMNGHIPNYSLVYSVICNIFVLNTLKKYLCGEQRGFEGLGFYFRVQRLCLPKGVFEFMIQPL